MKLTPEVGALEKLRQENASLIDAIESPRLELRRLYEEMTRSQRELKELSKVFSPSNPLQELHQELRESSLRIREHFAEMHEATRITAEMFKESRELRQLLKSQFSVGAELFAVAKEFAKQYEPSSFHEMKLMAQEALELAGPRLDDIEAAVREASSGESEDPGGEEVADSSKEAASRTDVDEWINSLSPVRRLFVGFAYRHFLPGLLATLLLTSVPDDETELQSMTALVQQTIEIVGPEYVAPLRCVDVTGLNVRQSPDEVANVIGVLRKGQFVEVVTTQEEWFFVRYAVKDSNELRTGWVFAAYLSKEMCR